MMRGIDSLPNTECCTVQITTALITVCSILGCVHIIRVGDMAQLGERG